MASDDEQTEQPRKTSQRRRRPRKLKRNEPEASTPSEPLENGLARRVETLDSRMQRVESQIQVMRDRSTEPTSRPRPRTRRQRSAATETKPAVEQDIAEEVHDKPNAKADIVEEDSVAENDDDVEEVVRVPDHPSRRQKAPVSLVGSYKLPLPRSVSEQDVVAITNGLSTVTNIARKVMAEAKATDGTDTRYAYSRTQSGLGWSSWFGSYSASVSRVINNIELVANVGDSDVIDSRQPSSQQRTNNVQTPQRKPRKLRIKSSIEADGSL